MNTKQSKQAGFVSILTVIMFMILTSIVTIGFVSITQNEQRQALNDDLSKGAYDAAQAGIEDAKRAIQYCLTTGDSSCGDLYNQTCPGFYKGSLSANLGLSVNNGVVSVGDASANQRYTCVTVSDEVAEYWGRLDPNSASSQNTFLPLHTKDTGPGPDPFDRVKISWSMKVPGITPTFPTQPQVQSTNPTAPGSGANSWSAAWPAVMRAMLISNPKNNFNGAGVESKSSFFVPASGGATQVAQAAMSSRIITGCSAASGDDYTCHMTILGIGGVAKDWYLQLAPFYQPTDFKVELFNGTNRVPMQGVGYVIDSTGSAADVYRRVQVLVGPDDVIAPNSAIQTGEKLCKDFWVTGSYNNAVLFGPGRPECPAA